MTSETHIAVGVASSLAVCRPRSWGEIIASVIGGALGGVLCDIECRSAPKVRNAVRGQSVAVALTVFLLAADGYFKTGLWESICSQPAYTLTVGFLVLLVTLLLGYFSEHRTFTHSLAYVLLTDFGLFCVSPMLLFPVLAGGISHLLLDTLNKRPVPWLYPLSKKGICLKLCYADRAANRAFLWAGLVCCIALLTWRIMALNI